MMGIVACLQYCFLCIERFLKMLTKNAYVEVSEPMPPPLPCAARPAPARF